MHLKWTSKALSDLAKLHAFLAPVNRSAAAKVVQTLTTAAERLLNHPRIGAKLDEFAPRQVHHIFVGDYEMRYEVHESTLYILRLWHTREDR